MPTLAADHIDMLRKAVRGKVLLPHDAGYDVARTVWNATVDRRPAVIVQCTGTADVMQAVNFARDHGLPVAVRGGGHNIAGSAICHDGLVVDLSGLRAVHIDPRDKVAWVSPGATLGDFDHEAQALALATPLGINSTTGVAGLTLGGGFGWLTRQFGMTVDNLRGCEVVTADGERRWADANHEPELFWALRGGGGNFGVVTLFEFKLHAVGPLVTAGLIVFPAVEGKSVLRQYRAFTESAMPDDMNVWVVLRKAPPLPFLPSSAHGANVVVLAVFYNGDPGKADKAIDPLRGFGQAIGEHAVYDKETGQLVSGSYMDYTMPRADDVPSFKLGNKVTPCPHNPLGVKGCGEAGAIAAPAAVMNAVHDALAPVGVSHVPMPATPLNVWQAINGASK